MVNEKLNRNRLKICCLYNEISIKLRQWFPTAVPSGGYSNLGARGKNFQKLMLSEKKRGLILACMFFCETHGVL